MVPEHNCGRFGWLKLTGFRVEKAFLIKEKGQPMIGTEATQSCRWTEQRFFEICLITQR
jgi:hypothetical protein